MGGEVDDKCATIYTARVIHNTHATYILAAEIDSLARFKVVEFARACNRDALVHPVALHQTLRDLPLHSAANAGAALLRARQNKQTTTTTTLFNSPRQPPSRCCCPSTPQQSHDPQHQTNLRCPSASHAVTRAASPRHPPTFTSPLHTCAHHVKPPPPSHAPAYQVDLLQALESAQVHAQRLNVVVLQLLQRVV